MPDGPFHYETRFLGDVATAKDAFSVIDDHLAAGGSVGDPEVERAIYGAFFDARAPDPSSLPKDEVRFIFGPGAVTGRDVQSVASRAALLSTQSYLVTPYTLRREVFPDPYDEYGRPEAYTLNVSPEFVELALKLRPYLLDGCIQLLAKTSTYVSGSGRAYTNAEHSHLLDVLLDEELTGPMAEVGAAAVEIPLQGLAGAGDRVLEARAEHQEEFLAFQHALAGLVSCDPEDGERALSESVLAVDEEVRRINESMEALQRSTRSETLKLALTPVPILLPILLPPPIGAAVELAMGVLGGGGGVLQYVRHLSQRRKTLKELKRDPFYVPWLLQKPA
jgi:hypothetical protein